MIGRNEIEKGLAFEPGAFIEGQIDRGLDGSDRFFPGLEAAEFARIVAADFFENFRMAAHGFDLVVKIADLAQRHVRVDHFAGEGHRSFAQFSFLDQRVDDAPVERLPGAERRSGKNGIEGILDAAQAGQALRASGAGNETELDLGQPEFCRRYCDAIMARERHFESAAQGGAMNGGDDRFRTAFKRALDFRDRRTFGRLAELGNIRAGDKGTAGADQNDCLDGRISRCLQDAVANAIAHIGRKRIHGWRIDRDDGDVAFAAEVCYGIDGAHPRFLFGLPV